ncbi:MAG: putative antigen protein [Thermoleophilia bacterium]|nr:putative antigen protein [Thermoleophilia bacterium]
MTQTDTAPAHTQLPHLPGHFYFSDVHTTDVEGASAFYGELFGWQYQEIPGVPNRYVTASIDGRRKAAITGLIDEQRAEGVASYWFPYLYVTDIDETVGRLDALGGQLVAPIVDVFDFGRMAVAEDPTGAQFGIWQDLQEVTTVKDEHGSPFWYELHTSDPDAALAFYRGLVGWASDSMEMGPNMTYHLLIPEQVDDLQTGSGGLMRMMEGHREAGDPSRWFTYFNVDDADAAYARAIELGAASQMEPHDIPGVGRSCWVVDPQGAAIALMTPSPRQG